MNGNTRIIMVAIVFLTTLSSFLGIDTLRKNMEETRSVCSYTYSRVEIMYSGFDTDTPFSVSPEMFDTWYDDTSIVTIIIKDTQTIAFIDSMINSAEPIDARTIDTRCRVLFTKNLKNRSVVDSFYLSSTIIYHKNKGIVLKNNQAIQKAIQDIVTHVNNGNKL